MGYWYRRSNNHEGWDLDRGNCVKIEIGQGLQKMKDNLMVATDGIEEFEQGQQL